MESSSERVNLKKRQPTSKLKTVVGGKGDLDKLVAKLPGDTRLMDLAQKGVEGGTGLVGSGDVDQLLSHDQTDSSKP